MDDPAQGMDICRVCRSEGMPEQPLFHPCVCTGSIKYVHEECLVQWIHHSGHKYCELCSYRFSFTPVYAPDMPQRLPIKEVAATITNRLLHSIKYWLCSILVGLTWACLVPFAASKIYQILFYNSFDVVMSSDIWSTKNISGDIFHGFCVVICILTGYTGIRYIREIILLVRGGPDWLEIVEPVDVEVWLVPEENPVEEGDEDQLDEGHWNPMDLDEQLEVSWKTLLGLDGLLVPVFCILCIVFLNALFIFMFAFIPYLMGNITITAMALQDKVAASHFESLVTILFGYCHVFVMTLIMHTFATIIGFKHFNYNIGFCYIVVKVFLLTVVKFGLMPLVCGWWLDICSLPMFDTSFKDRLASFHLAPGTSMFIHWLVGTVYVDYIITFVQLFGEVIRPDVLWLMQNLDDPNFTPIQEFIQQGMMQQGQRLIVSTMILGTSGFTVVWLPIQILKFIWPSFLPYNVTLPSDSVNELPMALFLLHYLLPVLLEQTDIRNWLKMGIRFWCIVVSRLLGIKSYLLGDGDEMPPVIAPIHPLAADLGVAHEELLRRGGPVGFRPTYFAMRFIALLIFMAMSAVITSLSVITIPVWLGRLTMSFWSALLPTTPEPSQLPSIHELYTAACGTFICWLSVRAVCFVAECLQEGRTVFIKRLKFWLKISSKAVVAFIVLLGIIPFLIGRLLELVILVPFRVPMNKTPVHSAWQDWILGVLFTKIACTIIQMGPDWFLRQAIQRPFRNGYMRLDLKLMMRDLAIPVIAVQSLLLAVPYVIAYSVVPLVVENRLMRLLIARKIYPTLTLMLVIVIGIKLMMCQFKRLNEHIKNCKYLVGRRLANYNHKSQN